MSHSGIVSRFISVLSHTSVINKLTAVPFIFTQAIKIMGPWMKKQNKTKKQKGSIIRNPSLFFSCLPILQSRNPEQRISKIPFADGEIPLWQQHPLTCHSAIMITCWSTAKFCERSAFYLKSPGQLRQTQESCLTSYGHGSGLSLMVAE